MTASPTPTAIRVHDSDAVAAVARLGIAHVVEARSGRTAYISGMISVDADGELLGEGDVERQTRACFEQIETLLAELGGGLSNVVKITTFLTDVSHFAPMAAVRREIFSGAHRPASSAVVVAALVFPGALIEIEAVAVLPNTTED